MLLEGLKELMDHMDAINLDNLEKVGGLLKQKITKSKPLSGKTSKTSGMEEGEVSRDISKASLDMRQEEWWDVPDNAKYQDFV